MKKIYLIAVIVAILTGFATYFFASQLKQTSVTVNEAKADVVMALQDIPKDTIVTADMFQVIPLPVSSVSYGSVISVNDIVGMMTNMDIVAGEQVLAKKLSIVGEQSEENRLSYQLEPGKYAYSLALDGLNGVSGFLKQGDYLNIYEIKPESTELLLENIEILRVSTYAANKSQDEEGMEITSYGDVVLILTKEQIETITQADTLKIVLVPYVEGAQLEDDLIDEPTSRAEIQTNYGMGEITTVPPTTAAK